MFTCGMAILIIRLGNDFFQQYSRHYYLPIVSQSNTTDVGPRRPQGSSPLLRRGEVGAIIPAQAMEASRELEDVETCLEGLTGDLSDLELEDVPQALQRHTIGVPARFRRFLRKVARAVACYPKH